MKKPILYRVETYIVPEAENMEVINEIQGLKKQFNIKSESTSGNNTENEEDAFLASYNGCEEFVQYSVENGKLIGIKIAKGVTNENETPQDEPYDNDIVQHYKNDYSCCPKEGPCVQKTEFQASVGPQESLYPARQFSRINSLTSIDERSENSLDTKVNNCCRHGHKNGCTSSIPSPEEISDEIFKENWLQKIEVLKSRETMLRERERNLQNRERELFRKEKQLRITERILNDKMKQVDEQLKQQKDPIVEMRLEEAARILSGDVEKFDVYAIPQHKIPKKDATKKEDISKKKEDISKKEEVPKKEDISKKEAARILSGDVEKFDVYAIPQHKIPKKDATKKEDISKKEEVLKKEDISKKEVLKKEDISKKEEVPRKEEISKKGEIPSKEEIPRKVEIPRKAEIPQKFQPIDIPWQRNERMEEYNKTIHPIRSKSASRKSFSRTHSYASVRYKERPKMNYEDLNSTLSAASPNSTPKRGSLKLFVPELYKKPYAFTRSASERRTWHKDTTEKLPKVVEEKLDPVIEEEKIFRKVSDNIHALQKNETRFQNYGCVDCIPGTSSKTERHTDNEDRLSSYLDIEIGERRSHRNLASISKDRPVSWISETNEGLQKKHPVRDSATKQLAENKENVASLYPNIHKTQAKKKSRKFSLFR